MKNIIKVKSRAARVIAFIQKLIIPSGKHAGKKFKLDKFQKKFIKAIYEPHSYSEGELKRIVRNAIFSIARKNGKTALIAALVLVHLVGPEAEINNEIYSAANAIKQAAQVFKYARQFVEASPELSTLLRVIPSTKTISCYANGSSYTALSREAGTEHGSNPGLVIYDELAQAKDMELFEVLDSSMGARHEPLMIVISTQSKDPQHILSQMIDDGLSSEDPTTVCHLYAVPDGEDDDYDIYDPKVWKMANPALGSFMALDYISAKAKRAARMPSFENSFMNLHLNMRVDNKSPLITRRDWQACKGKRDLLIHGEKIYLGLDLSSKTDLSALVAISAEDGDRVESWFWKPKELFEEHQKRDRAPYIKWEKEGWIIAAPGKVIDYDHIALKLIELNNNYEIVGMSYDRYRIDFLLKDLLNLEIECYKDGEGSEGIRIVPFGQGYVSMAPAIDEMETSIIDEQFQHNGNPVLTWNFSNAVALSDPAGNRKLDKQKARFRIDGAVATVMAKGLKAKDMLEPQINIDDFLNDPVSMSQ